MIESDADIRTWHGKRRKKYVCYHQSLHLVDDSKVRANIFMRKSDLQARCIEYMKKTDV